MDAATVLAKTSIGCFASKVPRDLPGQQDRAEKEELTERRDLPALRAQRVRSDLRDRQCAQWYISRRFAVADSKAGRYTQRALRSEDIARSGRRADTHNAKRRHGRKFHADERYSLSKGIHSDRRRERAYQGQYDIRTRAIGTVHWMGCQQGSSCAERSAELHFTQQYFLFVAAARLFQSRFDGKSYLQRGVRYPRIRRGRSERAFFRQLLGYSRKRRGYSAPCGYAFGRSLRPHDGIVGI